MRVVEERLSDGPNTVFCRRRSRRSARDADATLERRFGVYATQNARGERRAQRTPPTARRPSDRATFEAALDELGGALAAGGGPFMLGDAFSNSSTPRT